MTVTLAIPHYRSANSLKRLLSALERQELEEGDDFIVIVVNDDINNRLEQNDFKDFALNLSTA